MPNRPAQPERSIGDRWDRRSAGAAASPLQAAAVVAALERFMRDTAPPLVSQAAPADPWRSAALLEAVGREPEEGSAWGEANPWTGNT